MRERAAILRKIFRASSLRVIASSDSRSCSQGRVIDGATRASPGWVREGPHPGAPVPGIREGPRGADPSEGVTPTAAMQIGDNVIHRGRVLVLLGHDPMSVPDRYAQVEDPETGERFQVAYDELEPVRTDAQGFDPAA